MVIVGRAGCREGDIEDERGDETRGRFEFIASDMIRVVSEDVEATTGVGVQYGRVGIKVGIVFGGMMLA